MKCIVNKISKWLLIALLLFSIKQPLAAGVRASPADSVAKRRFEVWQERERRKAVPITRQNFSGLEMTFYNPTSRRYVFLVIRGRHKSDFPDNPFGIRQNKFTQLPPTNEIGVREPLSDKEINNLITVLNKSRFISRNTGPYSWFSDTIHVDPLWAGGYVLRLRLRGSKGDDIYFLVQKKKQYGRPLMKWNNKVIDHLRQLTRRHLPSSNNAASTTPLEAF